MIYIIIFYITIYYLIVPVASDTFIIQFQQIRMIIHLGEIRVHDYSILIKRIPPSEKFEWN